VLLRLTLVVVSVLAIAWLGVLLRDFRIVDSVSPGLIEGTRLSDAEFRRDAGRLEDAGLLNPDSTWRYTRGVAWIARDPRRASGYLEELVRDEPENVAAWRLLFVASEEVDPPLANVAKARVRRLDPLGGL